MTKKFGFGEVFQNIREGSGSMKSGKGDFLLPEITKEDVSVLNKFEPKQKERSVICIWE